MTFAIERAELEAAFREHGVRRLVVVDGDSLVGIVSLADVGRALQEAQA